jgi:hypothetical protein
MKKYTVLASLGLFLMMFFQNCGKPPSGANSQELTGVALPNQQYNKYEVGSPQKISLWDFNHARFLDLDLKSGQMVAYEQGGQMRGETFQVSPERMSELQGILNGAEICEPIVSAKSSEDQMCAMVYRYPYATMMGQGDEVRLGEATSGCDIPTDLCGEKAKQLQSWSKSLVDSL